MDSHRLHGSTYISLGILPSKFKGFIECEPSGDIPIQGIVGGCLICHQIRNNAPSHYLWMNLCCISYQANRFRNPLLFCT